jgi:hypothetical protein
MTIKAADYVAVKKGQDVVYDTIAGALEAQSGKSDIARYRPLKADRVTLGAPHLVSHAQDGKPNVLVTSSDVPVARRVLDRVWLNKSGGIQFREGDWVKADGIGFEGSIIDYDPINGQSRSEFIPVMVGHSSNRQVPTGQVALIDPSYLRVSLSARTYKPAFSLSLTTALDVQAEQIKRAFIAADKAVLSSTIASAELYVDVTADVKSWKDVKLGDVVTARSESTQVGSGAKVTTERTSVVSNKAFYGTKVWCELELDGYQDYPSYKIIKVERKVTEKPFVPLAERRKPCFIEVKRLVPVDGVWSATTRWAEGDAVVEQNFQSKEYWLYFIDGEHNGKKIRLESGRDVVQYQPIAGQRKQVDFATMQELTHTPA